MEKVELQSLHRLDQHITKRYPDISRSVAAKLIEDRKVKVNGRTVTKPAHRVSAGDNVIIERPPYTEIPHIELPILYEDRACVVINKPVGILSHSKGAFNTEATVATWLAPRVTGLNGNRAGIVHRLDRATSGVMICAKTPDALAWLQKQFSQRKVKKEYIAVVAGVLDPPKALIDMPIERNPKKPQTFRVSSNGKPAVTLYETVKTANGLSLLNLQPETGRTHQLRVHLSQLGHPILGDILYGGGSADRLFLHALSLEITLPSKKRVRFEAPLPDEFGEILS